MQRAIAFLAVLAALAGAARDSYSWTACSDT
jgi:hypothetical protein